jgi:hypothetical protein
MMKDIRSRSLSQSIEFLRVIVYYSLAGTLWILGQCVHGLRWILLQLFQKHT